MKDSKEKEHRISNLKDMINNVKEDPEEHIFEDIEEDSELINYLNENSDEYDELEIDDEFIYHPGDDDSEAINLEEDIDENFMIKTPTEPEENTEEAETDEVTDEIGEELTGDISEGFDSLLNAKIGRTPVVGIVSTILGLIFVVLAAVTFQSRSDKIVDNVMSGENSFIVVIFLIIGLFFLIYGLYRVIGLRNPLSSLTSSIDSIQKDDDEDVEKTVKDDENIIPKSNIPLDKESYKIGEFNFKELKNNLKKPKTTSEPKTAPIEEDFDDIPPAREKPEEMKGLTREEMDEIEYEKAVLDNESIDDIFAEVEDIEDIPIISVDSEEEKKRE